ncbi:hypothetical protein H8N03_09815 [Ramlibacter sp. USB13]|uniref:General stress protein 17M-like domain-containing protein n=1 Tax=Ramlibacter cellulosilyticus TaxID=2764187 RepID=A0A923MQA2_9BURK|nr:hypothetical protein [Ramlibacter cellulosilyticus]MBC5783240.1 hypothetical protein [Ramlibacter cellulosilyticus]
MHTAICTFEDRALAQQAVDRLVQAGYDRHDIHMEQRHPDGSPMEERRDHDVVGKFSFFERLFGAGKHAPHAEAYTSALEKGLYVVMVEDQDEAHAARAQDVLHGMEAREVNLVHRAGQQPLRDVVAEQGFGTARSDMGALHNADVKGAPGEFFPPEREPERAMASQGWGEQRKLEVVDEDKPIASPDIPASHEDKPR